MKLHKIIYENFVGIFLLGYFFFEYKIMSVANIYALAGYGGKMQSYDAPVSLQSVNENNVNNNNVNENNVNNNGNNGLRVTSVKIPENWKLSTFQQPNFGGTTNQFVGPDNITDLNKYGAVRSLILSKIVDQNYNVTNDNQFVLYSDNGSRGFLLTSPMNIENITSLGIPNNDLKFVKVGRNVNMVVYDGENYVGDKLTINGPYMGSLGQLDKRVSSFKTENIVPINKLMAQQNGSGTANFFLILLFIIIFLIVIYFIYKHW